jgi:hypothetical protein
MKKRWFEKNKFMKSYIFSISIAVCMVICTITTVVFVQSSYSNRAAQEQSHTDGVRLADAGLRYQGTVIYTR